MASSDVFTVFRTSPEGDRHILTMTNVTSRETTLEVTLSDINMKETEWYDIVNDREWNAEDGVLTITMDPYDMVWLKPRSEVEE